MDIEAIEFGIFSPAEILAMSVCEIKYDKQKKASDLDNTLYDPRMGPVEDEKICPTCKKTNLDCPGHFGHIILNEHIIYPLLYGYKTVLNFLKCFCFQCSRLIFSKEKLELNSLDHHTGIRRYLEIVKASEKMDICSNCGAQVPKFYIQNQNVDPRIMMFYKLLTEKKSKENSIEVAISEIERVFKYVNDEDIVLFGFDPRRLHPSNLVLSIIPVLPPCSRPHVISNGEKCEDDLTTFYRDICKDNARILTAKTDEERLKEIHSLSFHLSVLMDNSKGRVKQPNGRAKKGIKERLAGKGGLFRGNLIGKRTNYSARTVVGGDPTLEADQIAVPTCISTRVTTPEMVTKYNLEKLTRLVNSGQAEFLIRHDIETGQRQRINLKIALKNKVTPVYHGDRVFRKGEEVKIDDIAMVQAGDRIVRRTGEEVIAEVRQRRNYKLHLGDEVHRHLQDGDWIIVNRQPTLHVGSMLGGRAKIQRFRRSIGIPLNYTTPMNCDFDGDEVNLHMPQTLEAKAEYQELISVRNNVVSGQSSRPIMGIVQDSLVGAFKMTQGWIPVAVARFNDICVAANIDLARIEQVERTYCDLLGSSSYEDPVYGTVSYLRTGRGLLSLALPANFNYFLTNKANEKEPVLKIRNGVFLEGTIDKSAVGPKSGSIHHYLSQSDALLFLTRVQHIVNNWMHEEGFSVGIADCIPLCYDDKGAIPQVRDQIEQCYLRAKVAESTQSNPLIAEIKVNSALNAARDVGQKLAKEALPKTNRFLPLVQSGSKGSFANITQITGLLGQQNISGKRLEVTCIDGKRTLPHYSPEEEEPEKQFEARGFIRHSFIAGLNPQEFWAHAASSREGIINTACTTAKTGYAQRRITEMLKNIIVEYDYSVRNSDGRIIQFIYGGDGLAPAKQHKYDGQLVCHVLTEIESLNTEYEMECFEQGISISTKVENFRREHSLEVAVRDDGGDGDDKEDGKGELSPVNSGGSGGSATPDSVGTPGSAEYDYDD